MLRLHLLIPYGRLYLSRWWRSGRFDPCWIIYRSVGKQPANETSSIFSSSWFDHTRQSGDLVIQSSDRGFYPRVETGVLWRFPPRREATRLSPVFDLVDCSFHAEWPVQGTKIVRDPAHLKPVFRPNTGGMYARDRNLLHLSCWGTDHELLDARDHHHHPIWQGYLFALPQATQAPMAFHPGYDRPIR